MSALKDAVEDVCASQVTHLVKYMYIYLKKKLGEMQRDTSIGATLT